MTGSSPGSAPRRSGILVVDKEAGITSFDAVRLVRRRLRVSRVGHAGTLDPSATGVLPILIGEATKLMAYLADADKEYVATVRLGVATETYDMTGRVVAERPVPPLDRAALEAALRPFVGRIRQVPPMYSAVHHEGRRLYELARQGVAVERQAKDVLVHAISLEAIALPEVRLRIVCGKGTYIRSLAADLGAALGCGAAVAVLVRARVGVFSVGDAIPSAALAAGEPAALWARVLPPAAALADWPAVSLDPRRTAAFVHGQTVEVNAAADGRLVRVHDPAGALLGVGELLARGSRLKPVRILHADHQGPRVVPV
jgi:tRNA pseudouridine55 synthase